MIYKMNGSNVLWLKLGENEIEDQIKKYLAAEKTTNMRQQTNIDSNVDQLTTNR